MRFAVVEGSDSDSSDYDHVISPNYDSDEESTDDFFWVKPNPRSSLGRDLHAAQNNSSDDGTADSEDEIKVIGVRGVPAAKPQSRGPSPWNAFSPSRSKAPSLTSSSSSFLRSLRNTPLTRSLTRSMTGQPPRSKQASLDELLREEPDEYEQWVKRSEDAAWRDGQTRAAKHRTHLRKIASTARQKVVSSQETQLNKEAEEMRTLLEGMVLKHDEDKEELRRKFKEREQALWKDIDDVIKTVERRQAEVVAAAEAKAREEAKRKKQEEDAKIAAAEKEALAQKAELERRAKEMALKEQQAKAAKDAEEQKLVQEKQMAEVERRKADKKSEAGALWRSYTEKQRWMKTEVTERVKADRPTITALNKSKRFITRWLGQTLNTKDSIVKITNDVHDVLLQQLPSAPSPASPTLLDNSISRPYAYLLSHLSKVLITQAESEITSKPASAFPLAKIVVGLMLRGHAALGDVVFARLVKKCPWVVPFYPSQQPNQSREEYEKTTGRGIEETSFEYISRMSSITSFFFAILQTPLSPLIPTTNNPPPTPTQLEILFPAPMRLTYAWTWLSLSLRDPMPAAPPIATLLTTWIEFALPQVLFVYGSGQTDKVREVIWREGVQGGKLKGDGGMAMDKLGLVLENWAKGEIGIQGRQWNN